MEVFYDVVQITATFAVTQNGAIVDRFDVPVTMKNPDKDKFINAFELVAAEKEKLQLRLVALQQEQAEKAQETAESSQTPDHPEGEPGEGDNAANPESGS